MAAQLVALGIVLNIVTGIAITAGIFIGFTVVVIYTFMGGMWSVSITDFLQTILIIGGLIFVCISIITKVPLSTVINTVPTGFFNFIPQKTVGFQGWFNYLAMWITIGLGSIPQQDVFQRVMASKSEKIAVYASFAAAGLYLTVAFMPLLLALYAKTLYPELSNSNSQLLLPSLIMNQTSLWIKVLFFGALLSAIMSTASGAILAPAAILSENILRPFYPHLPDAKLLQLSRISVLIVAVISLGFALMRSNIYELVSESSALSLVSLFVPMVAGIYINRTSAGAAILSMVLGMGVWLAALAIATTINPLVYGLGASILGLVAGLYIFPQPRAVVNI